MDSDEDHNYADKNNDRGMLVSKLELISHEESYNLADVCRICMLNDTNLINLWSLPTENFYQDFHHIKDVLASFASVNIEENENLPQGVCEKCEANIYFTYSFKQKCEMSEEIFKNLLKRRVEAKLRIESIGSTARQEEAVTEKPIDLNDENPIDISYTCDQCSKTFEQRLLLNQHIKNIHTRLKCEECGETFAQPQILRRHRKIHLGIKNKLCTICGKGFLRSDDLKRHIRVHTGEKPFKCDQCPKTYKQSSELTQHKLTHSNVKQFICQLCKKSMATRNGYYIHMKVHNGQKDHQCHLCDKKFVTSSELRSHIRYIHMKEKRFECTISNCSKRFVTKICLNKHLKIHAGKIIKPNPRCTIKQLPKTMEYQCPICAIKLPSTWSLKHHITLHEMADSGGMEKEFVCEICEKKFEFYSTLTEHIAATHKNFACELCDTTILDYDVFVLHRELHNDQEDDVLSNENAMME